jgi:hypothetical protein
MRYFALLIAFALCYPNNLFAANTYRPKTHQIYITGVK